MVSSSLDDKLMFVQTQFPVGIWNKKFYQKIFNEANPYENPSAFDEEKEIKFPWYSNYFPVENPRKDEHTHFYLYQQVKVMA